MTIRADEQRLALGAVVSLYTIDATSLGGDMHRFTPGVRTGQLLTYQGLGYRPMPIDVDGIDYKSDGAASRPTLTVSRLDTPFVAAALSLDDLRGATVKRLRTLERYLDGQTEADPSRHWPEESWRIESLQRQTRESLVWILAAPLDLEGLRLPRRQVLRDICAWRYRRFDAAASKWDYSEAECPYTGAVYYDADDQGVADARADRCSRRLTGCCARFPHGDLPFGGFIAVGRVVPRRS